MAKVSLAPNICQILWHFQVFQTIGQQRELIWNGFRHVRRAGDSAKGGLASGRRSGSGASQLAVDGLPAGGRPSLLWWKSRQQSVGPVGRSLLTGVRYSQNCIDNTEKQFSRLLLAAFETYCPL